MLAALTVYSWTRSPAVDRAQAATSSRLRVNRPMRVSAEALGTSTEEIVARLLLSHSQVEMRRLAEQLGAVGDDAAINAVLRLVADPRPGVPELIITAIGAIGTKHAVSILIDLADDPRDDVQWAAVIALGSTGSERAETFLVGLAKRNHATAITALGDLATDRAVEVLYRIASTGADDSSVRAISTLGSVDTPAAREALARLIDSPSLEIATKALAAVQNIDDVLLAKLTAILRSGESQLARPAALAIAHVGDRAVPVLRALAIEATSSEIRVAAVQALGTIRTDAVVETLGSLVENGDDELAREAARSLAQFETPEARDVLISAALSDRGEATQAIDALVTMQGHEIDQALLEIAKAELFGAERALGRLLTQEHSEALDLVIARAGTGSVDERYGALQLLADAGTETTAATLIALVRGEHGELKVRALELVTRSRPGDPQVTEVLRESLHGGDPEEKRAAATALGSVGTDEARDALVSALSSGDADLSSTALSALSSYRLDEAACTAIHAAAIADPSLTTEAMVKLLTAGSSAGLRLAETALAGNTDIAVRTLQYLAESNPPGANELIVRSMRSSDVHVRVSAIRALASTRPENAVDLVGQSLRDASPRVRHTAASTLSSLGGERSIDLLIDMTRSSEPSDRLIALQNLPDGPKTITRTRELLRDPDSYVVYSAMRSLAASHDGVATLRSFVFDHSRPEDSRYDAATMLESYGRLDDATTRWLDETRARYRGDDDE